MLHPTLALMPAFLPLRCGLLALLVASCLTLPAAAQRWEWPENPENLKVLPEDIAPEQLRAVMTGFTGALGVRCHHCHVGEEGQPFTEWDFASDEKPEKDIARDMMRMVSDINGEYLADIEDLPEDPVQVRCVTCHRGVPRPMPLEDLLADFLPAHGPDSTVAEYRALRERYYGGFAYDFRENTLLQLADRLSAADQPADALVFLKLNEEMYPDSWRTQVALGDYYRDLGDKETARQHYERALELSPDNQSIQRALQQLE